MRFVEILALLLAAVMCALFGLAVRRRYLLRGNGSIDLCLRLRSGETGGGWAMGVGRYVGDELRWYRAFTFAARPARALSRRSLRVIRRREPEGPEVWSLHAGAIVLECDLGGESVQIAMTEEAMTGFLSWLESLPPGYRVPGFAAS